MKALGIFGRGRTDAEPGSLEALGALLTRWLRLKGHSVVQPQVLRTLQDLAPSTGAASASLALARQAAMALDPRAQHAVLDSPQAAALPLLCLHPEQGWQLVLARLPNGLWRSVGADRQEHALALDGLPCLHRGVPEGADGPAPSAWRLLLREFRRHAPMMVEVTFVSVLMALVSVGISLYSMQVYDRVIPNQGAQTLWVLTLGVGLAVGLEWMLRLARSALLEPRLKRMDVALSQALMARLNAVRTDQRPPGVGTLASQVQGFEMVRAVLSTSTLFLAFDLPMALLFVLAIMSIGGSWMGLAPAVLLLASLVAGGLAYRRIRRLTTAGLTGANAKTGLLVESIDGSESIKGLGATWRFESRWASLVEQHAGHNLELKRVSDNTGFLAAALQQAGYIAMVCLGATLTIQGELTQGGIIACSILSGRVLAPAAGVAALLVQFGNARSALHMLDAVFKLEGENAGVTRPIVPDSLRGELRFDQVGFTYRGQPQGVDIGSLQLRAGEKVAVLGPVGAGKSTLLALAAGLLKPSRGTVLLDGVDMQQLHADWRASHLAYLPQTAWMFAGTLRENLLFGQPELADDAIIEACQQTGLWPTVCAHPMGLDRPIAEGGHGLSGGQRQLVAITRLLLAGRQMWLLDEPTSGLDDSLERRLIDLLKARLSPEHTLIVSTHRPAVLALADRIVVLTPQGIVLDGPRDAVLAQLSAPAPALTTGPASEPAPAQEPEKALS